MDGNPEVFQVEVGDSRRLDVRVSGPDDGTPFFFLHGTPGSGTRFGSLERAAHARGMRFVTTSRPGYGTSSRHPGRRIADVVADVAAVLDDLGAARCVVSGWSGGGPHALACAARLGQAAAALVIASPAPYVGAPDLDWLAGMGEDNVVEFGAAMEGADAVLPFLEAAREILATASRDDVVEVLGTLLPEVDRAALRGELGDDLVDNVHEGLGTGVDGWLDDDLAFVAPWGFDVSEIGVPVSLWQGSADLMVPRAHAEWLARHVPAARLHIEEGAGHLSVADHVEAMFDEVTASVAG